MIDGKAAYQYVMLFDELCPRWVTNKVIYAAVLNSLDLLSPFHLQQHWGLSYQVG
jgi:hypothetical protein